MTPNWFLKGLVRTLFVKIDQPFQKLKGRIQREKH